MGKENINPDFFKNLGRLQYENAGNFYVLKRSFGQTIENCDIRALTVYMTLQPFIGNQEENYEAGFLTAGLYCNLEDRQKNITEMPRVLFEKMLGKMYQMGTASCKKEILTLINTEMNKSGVFEKRFAKIAIRMRRTFGINNLDYYSLFKDLLYWNADSRYSRIKWAKALTYK